MKCKFHRVEVNHLGLIIGTEGVKMDTTKIETMKAWPTPECLRDVRAFLVFPNFYRRFIRSYLDIIRPMTLLTKKEKKFE